MTTKRATLQITVDEWRAEVERVMGRSNDDGLTTEELGEKLSLRPPAVRVRLRALARAGKLGQGWRDAMSLNGVSRRIPVYWVIKRGGK